MAAWDLKARLLGVSLVDLLGPRRRGVEAYGSGGFTTYSLEELARQLGGWTEDGFTRVKMKIGRDPRTPARVAAAREAVGPDVELFVDANGAFSAREALAVAESLRPHDVRWFEEPVSSDDLDGLRFVRNRAPPHMAVAAGEYGYRAGYFDRVLGSGAVDVLQADATRCGVTGFLAAATLCDARGMPLSAHCATTIHASLGCAAPRVVHVEYFHDHARIESMLFDGAPEPGARRPSCADRTRTRRHPQARGRREVLALRPHHRESAMTPAIDVKGLWKRLRETVEGEVRFDPGSRGLYAQDASNYYHVPLGVVLPRSAADVGAILAACRAFGAPVVSRTGGTALAGQTCNEAVVLDFSKYMRRIVAIDPANRVARVEPGVVCDELTAAAKPHRLTWGPKPATHSRCGFGGMLSNNCGGMNAQYSGIAVHNVEALDVILYDGTSMHLGSMTASDLDEAIARGDRAAAVLRGLRDFRDRYATRIRDRYPRLPRRVSGYNLDELLPREDGRLYLARTLVGTEGTCATIVEATIAWSTSVRSASSSSSATKTCSVRPTTRRRSWPSSPTRWPSRGWISASTITSRRRTRRAPGTSRSCPRGTAGSSSRSDPTWPPSRGHAASGSRRRSGVGPSG